MDGDRVPSSERAGLAAVLDKQRTALVRKAAGVNEVNARLQPTAGSLSLLSLIKHCAVWEVRWFGGVIAGQQLLDGWPEIVEEDAEFLLDEDDTLAIWLRRYQDACNASRAIAASMDLDAPCARPDVIECNVRWVMLHLIEETARHAGHADLIREAVDGSRGMEIYAPRYLCAEIAGDAATARRQCHHRRASGTRVATGESLQEGTPGAGRVPRDGEVGNDAVVVAGPYVPDSLVEESVTTQHL